MASIGPVSINTGSVPTRQWSTMRARAVTPSSAARSADIRRSAPAPSEICDDVPAVWMPSSRATGFSAASASRLVERGTSSIAIVRVPETLPFSSTTGASTGTIWSSNRPCSSAAAARSWERRPKASASSRVIDHFSAIRSAPSNWLVSSKRSRYERGVGRWPFQLLVPIGTWLIDSTPHATTTPAAPDATRLAARFVACCDEPHCESTVAAAVATGRPAVSQAVRVMFPVCSATWPTQPPTTWSTASGSTPVRRNSSASGAARRSAGCSVDNPPLRRPTGVRTAPTTTTSVPVASPMALAPLSR